MKKIQLVALAVILVAAGCAVQKELVATGGSRADGTVELSFDYGMFEQPQVDMSQAKASAVQTCAGWGYTGSQPFGGQTSKCEQNDGSGNCLRTMVTVKYQCTGTPPASK